MKGMNHPGRLAMPMYAIATIPLFNRLSEDAKQVWYADDAAALGTTEQLRVW